MRGEGGLTMEWEDQEGVCVAKEAAGERREPASLRKLYFPPSNTELDAVWVSFILGIHPSKPPMSFRPVMVPGAQRVLGNCPGGSCEDRGIKEQAEGGQEWEVSPSMHGGRPQYSGTEGRDWLLSPQYSSDDSTPLRW